MFIKKDKRKINEILQQEAGKVEELKLSKRTSEFQGTLRILCHESKINALKNLKKLNLYDNTLSSVEGIGILSQTPLEELNIGGNKLDKLPMEFGTLQTLKELWLDDNHFDVFPSCLCQLQQLTSLRMSGNGIKTVPTLISSLDHLEILALDNNQLSEFPEGCANLPDLKQLWIRQNRISRLPDSIDLLGSCLQVLSISSNSLLELPEAVANLHSLRKLYANGNMIRSVPENLCMLPDLQEVNLANNQLASLPSLWVDMWGKLQVNTGYLVKVDTADEEQEEDEDEAVFAGIGTTATTGNNDSNIIPNVSVLLLANPIVTIAAKQLANARAERVARVAGATVSL